MILSPISVASILADLEPAARFDTTAGAASLADLCAGAQGFELRQGGQRQLAYAVKVAQHKAHRVAWIMAAAGHAPGVDLTATVLPAIEYQARELECSQVAITTIRPGLIRKLKARGYTVTGVTLRKNIA